MLDLGSRPSSDVAQQTCSQLRPRSSRCLTSCGFSLSPASTAFQSNARTSGSKEVLDTIFVGPTGGCGEPSSKVRRTRSSCDQQHGSTGSPQAPALSSSKGDFVAGYNGSRFSMDAPLGFRGDRGD